MCAAVALYTSYTSLYESFRTGRLSKCVHIVGVPLRSQVFLGAHIFRFGVLKHWKVEDHIGKSNETPT